jgi:hypothetical protein
MYRLPHRELLITLRIMLDRWPLEITAKSIIKHINLERLRDILSKIAYTNRRIYADEYFYEMN